MRVWLTATSVSQISYLRYVYPQEFQTASGWYYRGSVWNQVWDKDSQAEYVASNAPARQIIEWLNRMAPGQAALFCQCDLYLLPIRRITSGEIAATGVIKRH